VALVGNPNTGKTTLFNALTGYRRKVANYPGVTVDAGRGPIRGAAPPLELLDLPGTYSLAAVSPDEMLVSNVLCGRAAGHGQPDVILAIAEASNLRRSFYLISQLLEIGVPVVVALNMMDIARSRGIEIDAPALARRLGIPVVPVVATNKRTVRPLLEALQAAADTPAPAVRAPLPPPLLEAATQLAVDNPGRVSLAEGVRILLDCSGCAETDYLARGGSATRLAALRQRLSSDGADLSAAEVRARYAWIGRLLDGVVARPDEPVVTWTDRIDRVLTHKVGGAVFLLAVLYVVFQSLFYWSGPAMRAIETGFAALGAVIGAAVPEGMLRSLIVDGLIGGVGGVVVFLPQIVLLFAFIAILEDCGYMARAAFMMDRLMRALGLSGRSFIPLLSGFACAVPAIMGTRTIADRRERFIAILLIPFMSCSARLPVYLVLTAALVPDWRYLGGVVRVPALVMLAMYLVGVVVAIPVAWLLRKTALSGPTPTFLLELPSYKWPRPSAIGQRVYLSARSFLMRAGTVILVVNLVVWALAYFPRSAATHARVEQERRTAGWDDAQFDAELAGAYLRDSYLGRLGRGLEPVIRPLGWDWRIGVSVLASFPARELVIATLGTLFNLGQTEDEGSEQLRTAIRTATWDHSDRPLFTLPVALSVMVFFALCAQCASTLVMIGRETRSRVWPVVSFVGMTTIAYFAAWGVSVAARTAGAWFVG